MERVGVCGEEFISTHSQLVEVVGGSVERSTLPPNPPSLGIIGLSVA